MAKNKPNELYINRLYDAPLKTVWNAWTDPNQVAKWWGPRGFTLTTHSKDLRPGGTWVYTMHGPDGTDYPNITTYHVVEKYARLVYDHGANEHQPPMFQVDVRFSETNGKTKMEMTMIFKTPEIAQSTKKFIKSAGGDSTWDRLGEYLESESTGSEKFFINRTFQTPIETMFKVWTEVEHLTKWTGPADWTAEYSIDKIEKGKEATYSMTNKQGHKMFGRVKYLEIKSPDTIVYQQQFADANGNPARHPMEPKWPLTMLTTVKLTAEDDEHTRVTLIWEPIESTPEEVSVFANARGGMTMGWTGSFDRLENYLTGK